MGGMCGMREDEIEDANDLLCPECKNFKFMCSCGK